MLEFIFKQDGEFSDPYYEVTYNGIYIGALRYSHGVWGEYILSYCRIILSPDNFIQIANKLAEINGALK